MHPLPNAKVAKGVGKKKYEIGLGNQKKVRMLNSIFNF